MAGLGLVVGRCLLLTVAAWGADLSTPAVAADDPAPKPAVAAIPPRIPTADFSARALMTHPVLSPDGLHLAARFSIKGEEQLAIADVTGKVPIRLIKVPKKGDLVRYFWAGNHTLIISLGSTVQWYDDEAYATRMTAFDIDAKSSGVRFCCFFNSSFNI